jgi:hypothetical protein|tara:strand:+ start:183 stop:515 length:333 start_codon:yes stop_codon:yes gene_type:complete
MFLIRRVCKVDRSKSWEVARILKRICNSYETNNSRSEAIVYMTGRTTPDSEVTVCAEWTQEKIESNRMEDMPDKAQSDSEKLENLSNGFFIEFHEIITNEKLEVRYPEGI